MTTTTYMDTNLHHDQVTSTAVTACFHLRNATPSHWHTNRQATVETATFGCEFVAARIATDQIIDLRYTLIYLGVPFRYKSYMFGENKCVVDCGSIPTSTLSKKSTPASYHRVREGIAAGYLQLNWKDRKSNPVDMLSKHWEFASFWPLLKPLLSGREIHMSSLPRQRGVTEFLLKRVVSIPYPNGQRRNQHPNVTPSGYPTQSMGLLAMVAPIAHITPKIL